MEQPHRTRNSSCSCQTSNHICFQSISIIKYDLSCLSYPPFIFQISQNIFNIFIFCFAVLCNTWHYLECLTVLIRVVLNKFPQPVPSISKFTTQCCQYANRQFRLKYPKCISTGAGASVSDTRVETGSSHIGDAEWRGLYTSLLISFSLLLFSEGCALER